MQIIVNRIGDSITGSYNGKTFGVSFDEKKYADMKEIAKRANNASTMDELKGIYEEFEPFTHESYKEVIESQSPYLFVNKATNRFYLRYNQQISKEPIPQALVDRILKSTELGMDVKPLVKCWVRFLRNPNYSEDKARLFAFYINQTYTDPKRAAELLKEGVAPERAHDMATRFQTPITDEGLIQTYKVSKEITKKFVKDAEADGGVKLVDREDRDYDVDEFTGLKTYKEEKYVEDRVFEPAVMGTGGNAFQRFLASGTLDAEGHIIKVGQIHSLKDWKMIDCNDRASCVPGLHCGNLDYIRSYQSEGTVTHYVFVDPMHIGAVVQDNTGALRVKQYFVYASFVGVNKSLYHSSTYGKLTDAEFDKMVAETVAKTRDEAVSAAQQAYDEKMALKGDGGLDEVAGS